MCCYITNVYGFIISELVQNFKYFSFVKAPHQQGLLILIELVIMISTCSLNERNIPTRATMSVASRPFCQNLAMSVRRPC